MLAFNPRLIVVSGRPGSGKTTLAHALARAVRCPAVCRDEVKEGVVHSLAGAVTPDLLQRHATETFFRAIELLLRGGVTLVAEAAFQHGVWSSGLGPLRPLAEMRVIVCTVDPERARWRQVERGQADPERARFHPDPVSTGASEERPTPAASYNPPRLDVPTLTVETTEGYVPGLEEIVSFALGAGAQRP